ncbi:extracellular solute-binding protein [Leifsonia shinshuensis]|uniref:ABC transporter substrate-binding protein n=1 Tax=Leifsonia shinshuensis TaxID=150026 RepID=UPI0028541FAB|nr:extracellular solute-binding protein [Leifsonia shinshuensis]MDR6972757.1 multiple sugar transport system substrate-binding protein [Leifsonia shinshuensis]
MKARTRMIAAAVGITAALALTACTGQSSTGSGTAAAGGDCKPSSGKVNLTFTTWVPGMDKVVDLWNSKNPDIQVKFQTGPSGNAGTYQNFFNQIKAGNAPDLGQVEYDALPNFRVQDGLTNIASCKPVADAKNDFVDWTWNQVTFGEDNAVYAIPQDTGPIAMFYRKDLFEQAGIAVPTTWDEYAKAAAEIRAKGAYITNFPKTDVNWFAGMVWQAGGEWFKNNGNEWTVNLTDDKSKQVADYWQKLIDAGQVSKLASFSDDWNKSFDDGQQWTWVSAVWGASTLETGAPNTAGKWAVAPMPQWSAGDKKAGDWGGSSTAVLKGSKHPYEAAKFAMWLNTDPEALALENKLGGLYPAAKDGANLDAFTSGQPFYGGQKIYDVFKQASSEVDPNFTWGPTMTQTYTDVSDGFGAALGGNGTLLDALKTGQQKTIDALKAQSIPVKG